MKQFEIYDVPLIGFYPRTDAYVREAEDRNIITIRCAKFDRTKERYKNDIKRTMYGNIRMGVHVFSLLPISLIFNSASNMPEFMSYYEIAIIGVGGSYLLHKNIKNLKKLLNSPIQVIGDNKIQKLEEISIKNGAGNILSQYRRNSGLLGKIKRNHSKRSNSEFIQAKNKLNSLLEQLNETAHEVGLSEIGKEYKEMQDCLNEKGLLSEMDFKSML